MGNAGRIAGTGGGIAGTGGGIAGARGGSLGGPRLGSEASLRLLGQRDGLGRVVLALQVEPGQIGQYLEQVDREADLRL